jgi:hypothetical protein
MRKESCVNECCDSALFPVISVRQGMDYFSCIFKHSPVLRVRVIENCFCRELSVMHCEIYFYVYLLRLQCEIIYLPLGVF